MSAPEVTPLVVPKTVPAPPVVATKPVAATPSLPQPKSATKPAIPAKPAPTKPALAKPAKKVKAVKRPGQKQIPTILGLVILVGSLLAGVLLFGNGTGVFAPRATPETTPQNIQVSNVTDKTFSVSFFTDEASVGYVKYGISDSDIKKQASDDRDQLSGVVKPYRLHQVTVRGLEPNTTYYYVLGTSNKETYDNNGAAYQIKTVASPGTVSPNNQTIYGTVSQASGAAEGAIVYVNLDGVGPLSTLVKSSGSWAISLSNAFNLDLSTYPTLSDDNQLSIKVQGIDPNLVAEQVLTIGTAQPATEIVLGGMVSQSADVDMDRQELLAEETAMVASDSASATASGDLAEIGPDLVTEDSSMSAEASDSSPLANLDTSTEANSAERTLDLTSADEAAPASATVIQTTQPVIEAKLAPNVTVKIEIHSDTAISQTGQTDAEGNVSVDVAALGENLEPGEHTATYSYIDPQTGEEVIKSYTFTVAADATDYGMGADSETQQIASADTSNDLATTYGSGNPYLPTTSPSPSLSAVPSASPTTALESSTSGRTTSVSTASGTYNAGSTLNTLVLFLAGAFFLATGLWSFFLARQFKNSHC